MDTKAVLYQKMLAYLSDKGADLGEHSDAPVGDYEAKGLAMRQQPWENARVLACGHTDYDHAMGGDCERITARLAADFGEMDSTDLLHYQRVLEATIDNRNDLMDPEAMKQDLTEVVRERFARHAIEDKTAEAKEFRERIASLG